MVAANPATLLALAARVEREAPSRELDAAIWRATNATAHDRCYWTAAIGLPRPLPPYPDPLPRGLGVTAALAAAPNYTRSLDAAVTLVPKGHLARTSTWGEAEVVGEDQRHRSQWTRFFKGEAEGEDGPRKAASALCAAALRAIAQEAQGDD